MGILPEISDDDRRIVSARSTLRENRSCKPDPCRRDRPCADRCSTVREADQRHPRPLDAMDGAVPRGACFGEHARPPKPVLELIM